MVKQTKKKAISSAIVFGSFLTLGLASALLFAPIIKTNADSSANVKVKAIINPVVSLALNSNTMEFNITPTSAGAFNSQAVIATVDTNSTGGYELFFSAEDNTTTMTSLTSESTIASDFTGTVTSSTMANNKWGYSLNATNYSKIPTLSAPTKIKDLDHFPSSAEKNTTVNIATKVDTSLPSGTYTKNVVFSAIAHDTPLETMQSFNCSSLVMHETTTLKDSRDGNTYTVAKLLDGNCWMTQNLKIANKTIDSTDSDMTSGSFTIPASNATAFGSYGTPAMVTDSTYGGYYNFAAATAGSYSAVVPTGTPSYSSSICPKGWKLPTGSYQGNTNPSDASTILALYPSAALIQDEPALQKTGYVSYSTKAFVDKGTEGKYYTSQVSTVDLDLDDNIENTISTISSTANSSGSDARNGHPIRCVAK